MTDRTSDLTPDDLAVLRDGGWAAIGFTGLFNVTVELTEPDGWPHSEEELAAFESRLPAMLPIGTNSAWMGLRVVDRMPSPTVLVVRKDMAAVADVFLRPR